MEGLTCPWNTIAMWNLDKIGTPGGFLSQLADSLHRLEDGSLPVAAAGIEEVAEVLVVHQQINPAGSKAKLVKVDGVVEWRQDFDKMKREENGTMTR